jgi:hypothetical protein
MRSNFLWLWHDVCGRLCLCFCVAGCAFVPVRAACGATRIHS